MNFNLPDSTILVSDVRLAEKQLQQVIDEDMDVGNLGEPAASIVSANQRLIDQEGTTGVLDVLRQALSRAPVFDIVLATQPHDSFLRDIGVWFRSEIHPLSLLKVTVRRSIGGGMILQSKNRVFDMSLRPKIIAASEKVSEVVRRV